MISNISPHSILSIHSQLLCPTFEFDIFDIEQENSFHWLLHGDPTSHRENTELDTKIGLLGFEGKFDENFSH